MQINLTGRNIDITSALRKKVDGKIKRITKHFDHIIDIHVVLGVDRHQQHAEATVNTSGKKFFAEAQTEDMYASIDMLAERLDRQVLKHKDKLRDHSGDIPLKSLEPNGPQV
ncbi:MAG: ribosome-associated translation inhibitor RaiA [Lysobacterales bacterium]